MKKCGKHFVLHSNYFIPIKEPTSESSRKRTKETAKRKQQFFPKRKRCPLLNMKTGMMQQRKFFSCRESGKNRGTLTHGKKINCGKNSARPVINFLKPSGDLSVNGMQTR